MSKPFHPKTDLSRVDYNEGFLKTFEAHTGLRVPSTCGLGLVELNAIMMGLIVNRDEKLPSARFWLYGAEYEKDLEKEPVFEEDPEADAKKLHRVYVNAEQAEMLLNFISMSGYILDEEHPLWRVMHELKEATG